jgi:hypothetical protein
MGPFYAPPNRRTRSLDRMRQWSMQSELADSLRKSQELLASIRDLKRSGGETKANPPNPASNK